MSRSLALAWLTGLGLLTWREVRAYHKPVPAGRYGAASGIFVLLGLLSQYEPAAGAASLAAWGFDLAVLLQAPLTPPSPAKRTGGGKTKAKSPAGGGGGGNVRAA